MSGLSYFYFNFITSYSALLLFSLCSVRLIGLLDKCFQLLKKLVLMIIHLYYSLQTMGEHAEIKLWLCMHNYVHVYICAYYGES